MVHLLLQDTILAPGTEWRPSATAWWFVRVADGAAYWLGPPGPQSLDAGAVLVIPAPLNGCIRGSQLGPTKLLHFSFVPDTIVGVFTVADRPQVSLPPTPGSTGVHFLPAEHPLAVELATMTAGRINPGSLLFRCQLLGFAVKALNALSHSEPSGLPEAPGSCVSRRLEVLVQRLSEADLVRLNGEQLARQCGCSVRHFRRLFRQAMGVSLQQKQTELRLLKARQLLLESNQPLIEIALACGFHHQSLFHAMFKDWFGLTPGQWRAQGRTLGATEIATSRTSKTEARHPKSSHAHKRS